MTAPSIIAAFALISGFAFTSRAQGADVCNPALLQGAYGFQLSGRTTISGTSKPVTSVGRLIFDGHGGLSGEASANFAGYFLGNPVTGKYEAHADCTVTWSLQDDSGAWQPFAGTLTPDLLSAQFHQSDASGPQNGTMQKVAEKCALTSLASRYTFSISGNVIPMNAGDVPRRISATGTAEPDAAGALKLTVSDAAGTGTISIDGDCVAQIALALPSGDSVALRGILVNGGKRILAMETDPGAAVTATFTAK